MINPRLLLVDGAILTAFFALFVVGTLIWKPRLWIQDFPEDIQALAAPKTDAEQWLTAWLVIPWFILLMGGFLVAGGRYGIANGFWGLTLHIYLLWQITNLFDLVIIDWIGMHLIDPQNPPFPGTEGAKGYRDYRFHLIGFLKGSVMGLGVALFIGGFIWIMPG
ncbi:MAG: hypothetical protein AAF702_06800 [Chloroflexota bacterium]